jgi:membrane protease YdiL (CAAX protease family)
LIGLLAIVSDEVSDDNVIYPLGRSLAQSAMVSPITWLGAIICSGLLWVIVGRPHSFVELGLQETGARGTLSGRQLLGSSGIAVFQPWRRGNDEETMTEILGIVTMFIPLFLIIWLANLAEARREKGEAHSGLAIVAYVFLAALYGLGLLGGLALQVGAAFIVNADPEALEGIAAGFSFSSLPLLAAGLWVPSLLGLLLLLPPVRRFFAGFTALDAESPVHAVSLSLTMLVVVNLMVTLGVGLANFADIMSEEPSMTQNTMLALWTQQVMTALLALIGVGWLTRRTWGETLERMGLTRPTGQEWAIGVGVGLGLVPLVMLFEMLASLVGLGADADVERLTEVLLGSLFTTPLGILTIGLSAGLGEESLFRGALQPRFGLIFTAILFALVHSNYGITLSTLLVLLLGFILGWLRLRYSTSTAMITHAVYNMALGLIAYLSTTMLDF